MWKPSCTPPRMSVSIVSPIMIVSSVARPSSLRAARIITGLGLPTLNALTPVAVSSMATIAPQPGRSAVLRRAVRIEVGGDQLGAAEDHPHGRLDHLEVERPALADDDVIGIVIDDGVAVLVQGREQAALADDEGGAARLLLGEKAGRRHGAGEDVLFLDVDAHAAELGDDVAARALAVVGQEAETGCRARAARG